MINSEYNILKDIKDDLKERNIELERIIKLEGGKNSKSYCLFLPNRKLLLKFFPKKELIPRDRLNSELNFLKFLNDIGYKNIPKPIFWNYKKNFIVLSWLDGTSVKKITHRHINDLIDFILSIQYKTKSKYLCDIGNASEAYFFLNHHFQHIEERINLLKFSTKKLNLEKKNLLLIEKLLKKISEDYQRITDNTIYKKIIVEDDVNYSTRIISPSDIGFHNILINSKNELLFFDFEYAGWDDSHKTISDLIIHPQLYIKKSLFYLLNPLLKKYVSKEMEKIRLEIVLKLYRLKWACIILNDLIKSNENDNINKIAYEAGTRSITYLEKSYSQINDYLNFQY